jgi:uncharacterized membrane protein YdjX (TVP38/TMEM64 family)
MYDRGAGFAVSLITKLVATAASYLIGRFLLREYIMTTLVQGKGEKKRGGGNRSRIPRQSVTHSATHTNQTKPNQLHPIAEYVWLRAVDRLLQERPWSANLLLRLSIIPAAIKSYGLGAMQAPALPFMVSAVLFQAALSYVLTDLGAGMQDPSDLFSAESKGSKVRLRRWMSGWIDGVGWDGVGWGGCGSGRGLGMDR